jgi:hypothetical protein
MHEIEMHDVSDEFARCWQAAGRHIQIQVQGPLHSWLKANLNPPFLIGVPACVSLVGGELEPQPRHGRPGPRTIGRQAVVLASVAALNAGHA